MSTEESYYAAVETHFVERRGSPLFITPSEWHLVWKWEQEGVPLDVVKEGIDRVFERPQSRRRLRKLGYCRQTVEAAFRRFRERTLGRRCETAGDEEPDAVSQLKSLEAELRRLAEAWRESELAAPAKAAAVRLKAMAEELGPASARRLEEQESELQAIENELIEAGERTVGETVRAELHRGAEDSLASYRDRMPEHIYASALRSAYRRRLRRKLGLVPLSLLDR